MSVKLFAFDLDGTLTQHKTKLDPVNRAVLEKLGENAKLLMVGLLAVCGQSVSAAFENPVFLLLTCGLLAALYWASRKVSQKHDL